MNHDMDMSGMGTSSSSSSSATSSAIAMSLMEQTFHSKIQTPLYTNAFTPQTAGQYAGAIIFLIVLGIVFRLLSALQVQMEHRWRDEQKVRTIVIGGVVTNGSSNNKSNAIGGENEKQTGEATTTTAVPATASSLSSSGASTNSETVVNGVTGMNTTRKERTKVSVAPWRWRVDMVRGLLQVLFAFVGYLLMLAVMTFNIGYLVGVLAGIFIGEVTIGRYIHLVGY